MTRSMTGFHEAADATSIGHVPVWSFDQYSYSFENFYHPFVGQLIAQLNEPAQSVAGPTVRKTPPDTDSLANLLDPKFLAGTTTFFDSEYQTGSGVTVTSYPKAIDLDHQLPYANYNWELLYHLPVAVAVHLTHNQRFAEAQKWFHYVFDPTSKDLDVDPPARFWKFLYFWQQPATADLATLLELLSADPAGLDQTQQAQRQDILTSYEASVTQPFQPFAVARPRTVAFQYYVVMKYLDNLIAWGDSLFSQMTVETVNEATLCYVLATNLLGPRPQRVPPVGTSGPKSYNELKALGLDQLGDALVKLEGQFPFNLSLSSTASSTGERGPLFGMGRTLYFCVPPNSKLLGYWDTVKDRLTKIRNCENIAGQVHLMPLFDPPIDPGMLVAAAAAGLDVGSVVSGLNQPTSPVRSPLLIQKALELASEVRSLGTSLLAAIEKGDAEHMARLRQTHEIVLQTKTQGVRFLQWQQAQASTESLLRSRGTALERYTFYLRLLGLNPDPSVVPSDIAVDHGMTLTEDNFADVYQQLVAKYDLAVNPLPYPNLQLAESSSPSNQSGASGGGQLHLNANEDAELNSHMPNARDQRLAASRRETVATVLTFLPELNVDLQYWGIGVHANVFGGSKLSDAVKVDAEIMRTRAGWEQDQGAMAARTAGYQRRADDWLLQANLASRELRQIGRQLLASLITEQAARGEHDAAKTQAQQSADVLTFLQTKFTNEELYGWMQGQLSSMYYQYYRFALDTARKAEATMKRELMRPELDATTYIQPNYWDNGNQGLLAGEALGLDIKRMDLDYHDYNLRELELTRHVSLRQVDPVALLTLRSQGSCSVTVPEWLFDRDCPGHYMRRIKSVAVSVPSVVGPYTNVNCTLTLQHSTVRVSPMLNNGKYARDLQNDDGRFVDYYGTAQTIVTSAAVSDSGMFETNLRDERFLPFEGAGAVSAWTLGLPPVAGFDHSTITDVILHIRYTARDEGAALAGPAITSLKNLPPNDQPPGSPTPSLALLLSLRHDFPSEWYAFTTGTDDFTANLTMDYFPYVVQGATLTFAQLMTVYTADRGPSSVPVPANLAAALKAGKCPLTVAAGVLSRDPTHDYYLVVNYDARLTL